VHQKLSGKSSLTSFQILLLFFLREFCDWKMLTRGVKRNQDNMEDDGALLEGTTNELDSVIALLEVYLIRFYSNAVDVDNFDVTGNG
jgi:hypothetical protein